MIIDMKLINGLTKIYHYFKGFFEIAASQTPRYHFVIEDLEITTQGATIKTRVKLYPGWLLQTI
jgi:hypothetical protein